MKPVDKYIYDEDGRLISATVDIVVCSPTTDGKAVNPGTKREYALFCTACEVTVFAENKDQTEMRCKGCDRTIGVRKPQGILQ
jgi:hypothetical protein